MAATHTTSFLLLLFSISCVDLSEQISHLLPTFLLNVTPETVIIPWKLTAHQRDSRITDRSPSRMSIIAVGNVKSECGA